MMILWILLGILVWIGCSFLSVGMVRYDFAKISPKRKYKPSREIEVYLCILGPLGLISVFIVCGFSDSRPFWGLKYKYDDNQEGTE